MAIEMRDSDLRLVRERDGLSVSLRPLQGLWTYVADVGRRRVSGQDRDTTPLILGSTS